MLDIMWKTIIFNNKKPKSSDSGFITIEVIIALFIAFAFLAVSLQTLVLGIAFKIQAQEKQTADKLIQEDIERLNDIGATLALGAGACDGDLNDDGTADDGYSQALWAALEAGTPSTSPDLRASLITRADGETEGKVLTLTRNPELSVPTSGSPNRILGIAYQVTDDTGTIIINRYVETIPDAALECS